MKQSKLQGFRYRIGQQFCKVGGDYRFEGVIVARFRKQNGLIRYVGENSDGLLFIFNEDAIVPIKKRTT